MAEVKQLSVPPRHPIFTGHFPGRPIVPGVMLLEWVLAEVSQATGRSTAALRVREAKFFTPLSPAQSAQLRLDASAEAPRCAFDIRFNDAPVARGVVEWDR